MIEIKEAVKKSLEALKEMSLIPEAASLELEEAELEDNFWVITFSYPDPQPGEDSALSPLRDAGKNLRAVLANRRAYKAVRLLAADGTIRGIKTVHA